MWLFPLIIQKVLFLLECLETSIMIILFPYLTMITLLLRDLNLLHQSPIIQTNLHQSLSLLLPNHLLLPPPINQSLLHLTLLAPLCPIILISLILLRLNLNHIIQISRNLRLIIIQMVLNLLQSQGLIILTNQDQSIQISLGIVMVPNINHLIQMVQDTSNLNLVLQTNPTLVLRINRQNPLLHLHLYRRQVQEPHPLA